MSANLQTQTPWENINDNNNNRSNADISKLTGKYSEDYDEDDLKSESHYLRKLNPIEKPIENPLNELNSSPKRTTKKPKLALQLQPTGIQSTSGTQTTQNNAYQSALPLMFRTVDNKYVPLSSKRAAIEKKEEVEKDGALLDSLEFSIDAVNENRASLLRLPSIQSIFREKRKSK